jgi:hypothetical protein
VTVEGAREVSDGPENMRPQNTRQCFLEGITANQTIAAKLEGIFFFPIATDCKGSVIGKTEEPSEAEFSKLIH